MPSIGVASIDHGDAAVLFAKIAIRARHSDGELGKTISAIALDMRFDDFDRMAPGTGGEAVGNAIGGEAYRGRPAFVSKRSLDEPTGRANARPMTGSATSGIRPGPACRLAHAGYWLGYDKEDKARSSSCRTTNWRG